MDSLASNQLLRNRSSDEGPTVGDIGRQLWAARWFIIIVTLLASSAAGFTAWLLPNSYRASVTLSPTNNSSSNQLGGLNSMASQFGGLASLAGISVGGADAQKAEAIAVLQSEALTEKYIQDNDLLPLLYKDRWDAQKMRWNVDSPSKVPSLWKANAYFKKKVRTVYNDPKTGLIILTITFGDPHIAAKWANDLVKLTNAYLRDKAVAESERNIAFLNEEAAKSDVVEVREAVYKIMENEISKVMLARGNNEYAFKVLDPAFVPERPYSPDIVIWILGGFGGGLMLSALFVLTRGRRASTG